MKKKSRCSLPSQITLNNWIPHEKRDYVRGTTKIGHWRGHDCIILIFIFEGFYEDHSRLLSENYYFRWKKWVIFVQSVMNQKLKSMTVHHQAMILTEAKGYDNFEHR